MSNATLTRSVTEEDRRIGNTILSQLGFMIRGCLDMKGQKCSIIPNGVLATKVIVTSRNNRGNIEIVLNEWDLYDLKVTRTRKNYDTGEETVTVLKDYSGLNGLDVVQLRQTLDSIYR